MRCEIIAVGTELLLGQINDTNSSWIGAQLARIGVDSHFQTKVGDNMARIIDSIRLALERSDAIIMCGGLGPTQDDITRDAIAQVMGVSMQRDAAVVERIQQRFRARGRVMPENNKRQADVPQGATLIAQMPGTAPGLICPIGKQVIYAVPGVPSEMREMVSGTILPDLQRRAGTAAVIKSRVLRTWGHSESGLAELLAGRIDELDRSGNLTLAFQASGVEGLKVRITAKAQDEASALRIIADEESKIREILGDLIFGIDDQTMESVVLDMLKQRGLTLGVAESVTGGMVSARLTAVPGASQVLRGSIISYASAVKFSLLGVPEGPVINAAAAQAMALGVCQVLGSDIGLAITGVAGPDEQEGQPVGTVFLGLAMNGAAQSERITLPGQRSTIRELAVISLLNLLRLRLRNIPFASL